MKIGVLQRHSYFFNVILNFKFFVASTRNNDFRRDPCNRATVSVSWETKVKNWEVDINTFIFGVALQANIRQDRQ